MEDSMSYTVGLYWDCENIRGRGNPSLVEGLVTFAESKGNIVVQNAYTRMWGKSSKYGNFLEKLGFCLVNAIFNIKNSVDYKCMSDCFEAAQSKFSPDIFILVTGDGDYTQVLNILRGYRKRTIVLAQRGSDSKKLREVADEFHFVDETVRKTKANLKMK
jgi:uncharacterized LabA/DUF88 family protein